MPRKIERTVRRTVNQYSHEQGGKVFPSRASPCETRQCSQASSVIGSRARASLKIGLLICGRRCESRASASRRDEHQLADEVLGEELRLGSRDLAQREGPGRDRPDLAALDIGDQVLVHGVLLEGAAEEGEVLEVERANIQLHRGGPPIAPAAA